MAGSYVAEGNFSRGFATGRGASPCAPKLGRHGGLPLPLWGGCGGGEDDGWQERLEGDHNGREEGEDHCAIV